MKLLPITLIFSLLLTFNLCTKAQQNIENRELKPVEMQQDFNYLRERLENTHPGLYMHTTKELMRNKMDSLYNLLNVPQSFYKFYGIVAQLIAEVKCEHTSCSPYAGNMFQKHLLQNKIFPFNLYFSQHKAYVLVNLTKDTTIHLGDEVCTINHQPVDSLEKVLFKYLPADGNMESSKEKQLQGGMAFSVWYYMFINRPESFNVTFKSPDGTPKERFFGNLQTLDESNHNTFSNPSNKKILEISNAGKREAANPWRLEKVKDSNIEILIVRTFSGNKNDMIKKFAKIFSQLKKDNVGNLIITLEDNAGGDEATAAELFSYLISKPTHFITAEYLITNADSNAKQADLPANMIKNKKKFISNERDGKFFATEETQPEIKICYPKSDRFEGKIYVYVTGGTASAASTLAAVLQYNNLATIVGNETAGGFFGGGSTVGLNLTLPNTGITAHTSIVHCDFAVSGDHDKDRGVIPDFYFVPTFSELINGNTSWQDYIIKLITSKGK